MKNLTFRSGAFKKCIEAKYTIDDMFEAFCVGNKDYDREGNEEDQQEFAFWLKDYYYDSQESEDDNTFGKFIENIRKK